MKKPSSLLNALYVNRSDTLQKSADSDIFILTSLWEGLPISLLEAMSRLFHLPH